jgi:hypothetical protein
MEKERDDGRYNGWANYETWTVSLWLDNEEHSYRYWRGEVKRRRQEAPGDPRVRAGTWTAEDAARFNLADQLKQEVTEGVPLGEASMYSDLLRAALSEVDWLEIVDAWMSE